MGSRRRQAGIRLAGKLKKNILVVLVVLAVSGVAGFAAPFYISQALYGVPWDRRDSAALVLPGEGGPQATPTWAKPSLPQVRFNFWVTATSSVSAAAGASATATPSPTAVIIPTRTKHNNEPTATVRAPTRTKKPPEPTSTPRPPRPTKTLEPTREPTNPPPPTTEAAPPTSASTSGPSSSFAATPTPHELAGGPVAASSSTMLGLQGSAAGAPARGFLWEAAGSLWRLLEAWWD